MSRTYSQLMFHVVFSTKERQPIIDVTWSPALYRYIGGIVERHGGLLMQAGGVEDHVHLLLNLRPSKAPSDVIGKLKASSSGWLNTHHAEGFQWQAGYGVFSVSASKVEAVQKYILDQPHHHASQSFNDELRWLLQQHDIDWDERYLS